MMEFGFEHLRWIDVVNRVTQGISAVEGVVAYIRSRAAAEERYGKALKDASTPGLFSSFMGDRSARDASRDSSSVFEALESGKQSIAKVRRTLRERGRERERERERENGERERVCVCVSLSLSLSACVCACVCMRVDTSS
jgi:hypothetical protein